MTGKRKAGGFTFIEVMIAVAILTILSCIAIASYRDYSRRASLTEVMMAISQCKSTVSENYATLTDAPDAGRWGCESSSSQFRHVGSVQTSADGVIRVAIRNLDRLVNDQYVHMVPVHSDGNTPMITPNDMGRSVVTWKCGSDWQPVRNSLPANCRNDTTTFASQDFN
ncbi:MAG TPA: pilin [Ramlibacter sp.]|nr:pilin [Ramlibacter sp.]